MTAFACWSLELVLLPTVTLKWSACRAWPFALPWMRNGCPRAWSIVLLQFRRLQSVPPMCCASALLHRHCLHTLPPWLGLQLLSLGKLFATIPNDRAPPLVCTEAWEISSLRRVITAVCTASLFVCLLSLSSCWKPPQRYARSWRLPPGTWCSENPRAPSFHW